jgi:hypothetical protein
MKKTALAILALATPQLAPWRKQAFTRMTDTPKQFGSQSTSARPPAVGLGTNGRQSAIKNHQVQPGIDVISMASINTGVAPF